MRAEIRVRYLLLSILMMAFTAPRVAHAQPAGTADKGASRQLNFDYTYLRSNAPPGGCGCFSLNGGSANFAWPVKQRSLAFTAEIAVAYAGSVSSPSYSLTLSTYTAGIRFKPKLGGAFGHSPLKPFGNVLIGIAHSSGSLVEGENSATANAGSAFAAIAGGGIDLYAHRRLSFRLIEADYVATTFKNSVNDHQNILRLGAGLGFHF